MLRRRVTEARWAEIFADDILRGCSDLFAVFGGTELNLTISIPIDSLGVVLLEPQGPLDAPRVPAFMRVTRPTPDGYAIRIRRTDARPLIIKGLGEGALSELSVGVTRKGLDLGPDAMPCDEATARALATALLITIGMKIRKAQKA